MPLLIQKNGLLTGSVFHLNRFPSVVGRSPSAADLVLNFPEVSRRHALFEYEEETYYLRDLNSQNKTAINSLLVSDRIEVKNGDLIHFGGIQFEFRLISSDQQSAEASTIDVPSAAADFEYLDLTEPGSSNADPSSALAKIPGGDESLLSILTLMHQTLFAEFAFVSVNSDPGWCWHKSQLTSHFKEMPVEQCVTSKFDEAQTHLIYDDFKSEMSLLDPLNDFYSQIASLAAIRIPLKSGVAGWVGVATSYRHAFAKKDLFILEHFSYILKCFFDPRNSLGDHPE